MFTASPSLHAPIDEALMASSSLPKVTHEEFQNMLNVAFQDQMNLEGQVVNGVVVSVEGDMALIDVNLKSEGRVPLKEFLPNVINVGDIVEVYIDRYEGVMGDVQLSHEKARQEASWRHLVKSYQDRTPVEGIVANQVKGGLIVDIQGTMAFLPGSQVDIRPIKDLSTFIGSSQQFLILKMDDARNNVVISRRAMLEASRASEKQTLLTTLEQGQHLKGVVKNLTDYGAFVDLGGIDGLLHITDISWKRIQHPSEALSVGQVVNVMVTRFNKETQRISLGMKQLEKDPWMNITERHAPGDRIKGVVTNVTDYGAFVEMDEGLEGLVYVGEMVWCKRNVNPRSVVVPGQEIEAMILDIDLTKRRISLGMKQCIDNPLQKFSELYQVGSEVEGSVKDITEFGLLVQLPEDLDGTVHVMDLSWDHEEEALSRYNIGQNIRMKVLNINVEKEMIGLGVKQLENDPWVTKCSSLKKGQSVKCTVRAILENGIEVLLLQDIVSIITRSELSRDRQSANPRNFEVGQEVEAKIIALNPESRHLALSIRAQELNDEKEAMEEYSATSSDKSLGAILGSALDKKE